MAGIYKRGNVWWIKFHLNGTRVQQSLRTTNKRIALDKKRQIENYCANIAAGMMLAQFTKYLRQLPIESDISFNLLTNELVHLPSA